MIGSIGVDTSGHRAVIGLLERSRQQIRQGPIGDGRRRLVPVAATGSAWGSEAADATLAALEERARLADSLYCWFTDPWSEEFLSGLRRRLQNYLGLSDSADFRTHHLCICTDPGQVGGLARMNEQLEAADLVDAELVQPTDALLCRWLAESPARESGTVLAVACGEKATDVALYPGRKGSLPAVRADIRERVPAGSRAWMNELAADVLGRCRTGVPPRALLTLLDGADEFAALLRGSAAHGAVDHRVEWAGPMSQLMFDPLRVSKGELAKRATVRSWTEPVADAARRMLGGSPGRATLVVGGLGAVWPFVSDVVAGLGAIWQSGDPALDLALGACWWPQFRPGADGLISASELGQLQPISDSFATMASSGTEPVGTLMEDPVPWSSAAFEDVPHAVPPAAIDPGQNGTPRATPGARSTDRGNRVPASEPADDDPPPWDIQ